MFEYDAEQKRWVGVFGVLPARTHRHTHTDTHTYTHHTRTHTHVHTHTHAHTLMPTF
jgi:hypothetical protein